MTDTFLNELSSTRPVPAGGAAAAYSATVGLALLEKIIRLELRRAGTSQEQRVFWSDLLEETTQSAQVLLGLRDRDGEAYLKWVEAKATPGEASERQSALLLEAVHCPIRIRQEAGKALDYLDKVAPVCKKHLLADVLVAGELLMGAIRGASHVVHANVRVAQETSRHEALHALLDPSDEALPQLWDKAQKLIAARLNPQATAS